MIRVRMGKDHGVDSFHALGNALNAQFRRRIHEHAVRP